MNDTDCVRICLFLSTCASEMSLLKYDSDGNSFAFLVYSRPSCQGSTSRNRTMWINWVLDPVTWGNLVPVIGSVLSWSHSHSDSEKPEAPVSHPPLSSAEPVLTKMNFISIGFANYIITAIIFTTILNNINYLWWLTVLITISGSIFYCSLWR